MPRPAATMMTPTLGGDGAGQLVDMIEGDVGDGRVRGGVPGRREGAAESEAAGFGQPAIERDDGPDLAGEADFSEEQRICRGGAIGETGEQRGGDGEVGTRLAQPHARADLDEHIERAE